EYRPVTPGVAGSSPVRSATNLKAFPIGKAFLLWAFLSSDPQVCTSEPTQSPASLPGFGIFSLLVSCRHPTTMPIPSPIGVLATVSTSVSQHIPSCDGTSSLPLVCVIPFFAYGFIPLKQSLIQN
ncbi:hypothetical protein, partial [Aeromonas veronii]|uniref:hypothetical protein n=1 Tax=Aeromonas veronii TaxID=654 RepID=UPI003B9EB546